MTSLRPVPHGHLEALASFLFRGYKVPVFRGLWFRVWGSGFGMQGVGFQVGVRTFAEVSARLNFDL